jgi:predicted nuclease of predicted toxin-antitoxin system
VDFILDENIPLSVQTMLKAHGHAAPFIREFAPEGSPDPLVATISEQMNAILISFDGDFDKIAPRIPDGQKARFRRLSRIHMQCAEYQSAQRLEKALSLVETEYAMAQSARSRMLIYISKSFIKTNR